MFTHEGRRRALEHMMGWQEYDMPSNGVYAGFIITEYVGFEDDYQYGAVTEMEENSWEGRQRVYFRQYDETVRGVKNDEATIFTCAAGITYAIGIWDQESGGTLLSFQVLDEPLVTTEGEVIAFNYEKIIQTLDAA